MKEVFVVFPSSAKQYAYKTNLNLIKGGVYEITANGNHTYSSYVKVVKINPINTTDIDIPLKMITDAKLIEAPPHKKSGIKQVYINKEKGTVLVHWTDNTKTMVKCQSGDEFDEEKGLMACYMKRIFENRGYYNDIVRKALKNAKRK